MDYNQSEVTLSVNIAGVQAVRGSFSHFHKINSNGIDINGARVEKPTQFCKCSKSITLSNAFVRGALSDPPNNLKDRIRGNKWKTISADRRIALHVNQYVKALHPDHLGYKMEII